MNAVLCKSAYPRVWPLLHMRSFFKVTGAKKDRWLVETVGSLGTCMGAQMLLASRRQRVAPEVSALAAARRWV